LSKVRIFGAAGFTHAALCFIKNLMDKTLIVGIGNLLCKDEGIGVHVIQEMKKMRLSEHIELLDIGTSTMDLISHLEGVKKLIVIDAMKAGGAPGTIYRCGPEDLLSEEEGPISLHEIGVLESLNMAKKMGMEIRTVIIGVEPKVIEWGMELSDEVKDKIPSIIEAVLKEG
jgi:hydrogenase maturation protease